jgi:hypothetical protein
MSTGICEGCSGLCLLPLRLGSDKIELYGDRGDHWGIE